MKRDPVSSGTAATRGNIPREVEQYYTDLPDPARGTLERMRAAIVAAMPADAAEEIRYKIPTFVWNGPVAGLAAFQAHCSVSFFSGTFLDAFREDLKEFSVSKGAIRFPLDKALPATLVRKLIKARVAQNRQKKSL